MEAEPYVYRGEWVADCTREGCMGTEFLHDLRILGQALSGTNPRDVRKSLFHCSNCQQVARIAWPPQDFMDEVEIILSQRPVPDNRNWYPQDHPTAVKLRLDHGQSLEQLREENREHGVPV